MEQYKKDIEEYMNKEEPYMRENSNKKDPFKSRDPSGRSGRSRVSEGRDWR